MLPSGEVRAHEGVRNFKNSTQAIGFSPSLKKIDYYIYTLWFFFLFLKVILIYFFPLFLDEAYYWVWSKDLQWSYYDHPPMIAWLLHWGSFFQDQGHLVRLPVLFMGHLTFLIWDQIAKKYLNSTQRVWFFLLLISSPLVGLGSIISTPDTPVLFFWSLSLLCLQKIMSTQRLRWFIFLGASLGLGFCSKYHIVIFIPLLLLWLTMKKKWRQINLSHIPVTIIVGLLFCFPVLYWNYQNDFVSFRFQLGRGLGSKEWSMNWTLSYLLGQILIIFPFFIWAALKIKIKKTILPDWVSFFAWGPVLFFFFTSFFGKVEANWPLMAYPCFILIGVYGLSNKALIITIVFWIGLGVAAIGQVFSPWLQVLKPSLAAENLKTYEPYKYLKLREEISNYQPFYAGTYQMASALWYYDKKPIYKIYKIGRKDFFDFQKASRPQADIFYVGLERGLKLPDWILKGNYTTKNVKEGIFPDIKIMEVKMRH